MCEKVGNTGELREVKTMLDRHKRKVTKVTQNNHRQRLRQCVIGLYTGLQHVGKDSPRTVSVPT